MGNETKCIYIPTLFDSNFEEYYFNKYKKPYFNFQQSTLNFPEIDYLYRQTKFLPCKESINLGTTKNPLYSCNKCYNIFENEEYDSYYYYKFPDYNSKYDYYYYDDYYYYTYSNIFYEGDYEDYYWSSLPVKIKDKNSDISFCIKASIEIEY